MERLDQAYLVNIVKKAQTGNSNAFAELFCAVSGLHFSYINYMIKDRSLAEDELEIVYEHILKNFPSLHNPALFMPWSCHLIYRYCSELTGEEPNNEVKTPAGVFTHSQLLNLPLSLSQTAIMYYVQGLSIAEVSDLLNIDSRTVRQCLKSADRHLKKDLTGAEKKTERSATKEMAQKRDHLHMVRIENEKAEKLITKVFERSGIKANTIPLEALGAYAVYRSERFSIQKGIIAVAIAIFVLLPLCFILPDYEVSSTSKGERGLPVYTVSLRSIIPARKVTARINSHQLPVYEASGREYTVEPTRNGKLVIDVELINRQDVKSEHDVKDVDAEGPKLISSSVEDGKVHIFLEDAGIGVDWKEIYATQSDGIMHYPVYTDEETGEAVFEYPQQNWDVYIPDHIGNMLHLSFSLE